MPVKMALKAAYYSPARAEMPAQQQLHLAGGATGPHSPAKLGAKLNQRCCFVWLSGNTNEGFHLHALDPS